ncbi:MAG: hypothetical protein QM736_18685 [Vicinamibacterales bacterium]
MTLRPMRDDAAVGAISEAAAGHPLRTRVSRDGDPAAITASATALSARDRLSGAIGLALVVGLLVGYAFGYGMGTRDHAATIVANAGADLSDASDPSGVAAGDAVPPSPRDECHCVVRAGRSDRRAIAGVRSTTACRSRTCGVDTCRVTGQRVRASAGV